MANGLISCTWYFGERPRNPEDCEEKNSGFRPSQPEMPLHEIKPLASIMCVDILVIMA